MFTFHKKHILFYSVFLKTAYNFNHFLNFHYNSNFQKLHNDIKIYFFQNLLYLFFELQNHTRENIIFSQNWGFGVLGFLGFWGWG